MALLHPFLSAAIPALAVANLASFADFLQTVLNQPSLQVIQLQILSQIFEATLEFAYSLLVYQCRQTKDHHHQVP